MVDILEFYEPLPIIRSWFTSQREMTCGNPTTPTGVNA